MSDFFTIVPGGHASPFILHVPHSSRTIPADIRAGMCATDAQLAVELDEITDTATDLIAERTAAATVELHAVEPRADDASPATGRPTPWIFRNDLSRLVIDPERFPDDREELNAVGRGAVYMKLCDGSDLRDPATFRPADMDALMDRFYHPYAAAMTVLTRNRLDATGAPSSSTSTRIPPVGAPTSLTTDPAPKSASASTTRRARMVRRGRMPGKHPSASENRRWRRRRKGRHCGDWKTSRRRFSSARGSTSE